MKASVLFIDDDESLLMVLEEFGSFWKRPVYTAASGEKGIALLSSIAKPCLVFLDIRMPGMDGHIARHHLSTKDVHIIMMSCGDPVVLEKQYPHRFMRKPFDIDVLCSRIEKECRRLEVA